MTIFRRQFSIGSLFPFPWPLRINSSSWLSITTLQDVCKTPECFRDRKVAAAAAPGLDSSSESLPGRFSIHNLFLWPAPEFFITRRKRLGRNGSAIDVYRRCKKLLSSRMGIEPSAKTKSNSGVRHPREKLSSPSLFSVSISLRLFPEPGLNGQGLIRSRITRLECVSLYRCTPKMEIMVC